MNAPETLLEAVSYFSNPDNAFEFFKQIRWPRGVKCPRCGSKEVTFLSNAKVWKCKTPHPKQKFSAKVGTIFEDSPIGLEKWLPAMWMAANCKNGVSSYELHRALGVTQKTAWFMLQRVRLAMQQGLGKLGGVVEADETYIGAKARYMHKNRRTGVGDAGIAKTPVQGILERDYDRRVIDHAISYAQGHVHTNGLENFWSLLKRALHGTYVNVEPFHLFRYLDEQAFRFNERKENDAGRFVKALRGVVGKGLRYAKLIGGEGIHRPETWQTI